MTAIDIQDLTKRYDRFTLHPVSFTVPKGYITGLIGPNGAGKSTIIKAMLGLVRPDSGQIRFDGRSFPQEERAIKEQIGFVSDENHFYEQLTVAELKRNFAPFYPEWSDADFARYANLFELDLKKRIKDLSKGTRMKVSLALALSHNARLLIMDEPTGGLDPVFRRELLDLLSDFIQDGERSVLFSTHITTDLDRVADYIICMNRGRLVFSESKESILERYVLVRGSNELLDRDVRQEFIGLRETEVGFEALHADRRRATELFRNAAILENPTLEDILYYTAKGEVLLG
ncbi:ABC transporter ATP-binding protein [Gorillibacterium sp. CAU 1737]|uniref:ABC transporter ATP-binding protein n=1 Tax=Gorillibacterium sp. CAU 1737 TaxID=3140362 RepID=UPI003260CDA7